jgi:Mg2+/Co2+ transporter CorB
MYYGMLYCYTHAYEVVCIMACCIATPMHMKLYVLWHAVYCYAKFDIVLLFILEPIWHRLTGNKYIFPPICYKSDLMLIPNDVVCIMACCIATPIHMKLYVLWHAVLLHPCI